jgi:hypothetical protein
MPAAVVDAAQLTLVQLKEKGDRILVNLREIILQCKVLASETRDLHIQIKRREKVRIAQGER